MTDGTLASGGEENQIILWNSSEKIRKNLKQKPNDKD